MTPENLALRRTGLGGSDIAAIVGESPYRTAIDVWLDKRGEGDDFEGNERTRWGNLLEPVVADEYARREGCAVSIVSPTTWRHPDRPWQLGSPDRVCTPEPWALGAIAADDWPRARGAAWGLEIKTHGARAGARYEDGLPPWIELQARWYQSLLDLTRYDVAALIDTADMRIYRPERDRELEDYLLEEAEHWWTRHIVEGVVPEPDGSVGFRSYLRTRYSAHGEQIVEGDDAVADALERYKAASTQISALEKDRELDAQIIQAAIGDSLGVRAGDRSATWRSQRTGPNYSKVAEELAEEHNVSDDVLEALKDAWRGSTRVLRVK